MNLIEGAILGLVQGLTEFLPVSSSGHLVLLQQIFNLNSNSDSLIFFDAVLHFGSLMAILFIFRGDIWRMIRSVLNWSSGDQESRLYRRMSGYLVVGSVPVAIIGFLFSSQLDRAFKSTTVVGAMLIITGGLLIFGERVSLKKTSFNDLSKINLRDSLWVGMAQGLALLPGLSRSGATITAGLLRGMERTTAARFSFLFSIPAIIGATGYSLFQINKAGSFDIFLLALSTFMAFLSGLAAISLLIYIIEKRKLVFISLYCFALGVTTLATHYL